MININAKLEKKLKEFKLHINNNNIKDCGDSNSSNKNGSRNILWSIKNHFAISRT